MNTWFGTRHDNRGQMRRFVTDSTDVNGKFDMDTDTYFAEQARLLVHDNTARRVTTALVPGLLEP